MNAGEASERFAEIVSKAAYGATRTVLMKHQKPVAAVLPIADLDLLHEVEDLIDVHEAKAALDEVGATRTKSLASVMAVREALSGQ
jgi:prevent-host-death family protein